MSATSAADGEGWPVFPTCSGPEEDCETLGLAFVLTPVSAEPLPSGTAFRPRETLPLVAVVHDGRGRPAYSGGGSCSDRLRARLAGRRAKLGNAFLA